MSNCETEQKKFNGYTLKKVHGNPRGQFTDKTITVKYIYTKNGQTTKLSTINQNPKNSYLDYHKMNEIQDNLFFILMFCKFSFDFYKGLKYL